MLDRGVSFARLIDLFSIWFYNVTMNKIIDEIFGKKTIILSKLPQYGFAETDGSYVFRTEILGGQMSLTVKIDKNGKIGAEVYDTETEDAYTLFLVEDAAGGFVGEVREEYERVLLDVAEKCSETEIFKSEQSKLLIEYCRNKFGGELEFLWKKFDDNAIWRRKDNNKWYGLICKVPKRKLGIPSDETVEIAGFRMAPEKIEKAVDNEKYFRAYHMNKKHWITVCLDGSLPFGELCKDFDDSYALAVK